MIDIANDIRSLTEFKRDSSRLMSRMKKTKRPMALTVNGKAELVVQTAAEYQKLLDRIEKLETIEGIRRGLESMKAGRGVPLEEFDARMRAKYNIPRVRQ